MKNILFLDLGMGAAGDMLSAALFDLLPEDRRGEYLHTIQNAGIPHIAIRVEPVKKSGIAGISCRVLIDGQEEESLDAHSHDHGHADDAHHSHHHDFGDADNAHHGHHHDHGDADNAHHGHHHEHGHADDAHHHHEDAHGHHHHEDACAHHHHDHDAHGHHHHEHHSMAEIHAVIRGLRLPAEVKADILRIYDSIAEAESRIHGTTVEEIHLHEVGMLDAIADIASVCTLLHMLAPDEIIATPVTTGYGAVHCAHGILPVPAPATACLLEGIATRSGDIEGELCTPTGAALIRYFTNRFSQSPPMKPLRIGYGMGKKDFSRLNCVRATLGTAYSDHTDHTDHTDHADHADHADPAAPCDRIVELSCNIDDMTGEEIGFAVEQLLENGAADVWTTPVQMKKNRPGVLISLLCREELRDAMVRLLFLHTTTAGIRETLHRRYILDRSVEEISTERGTLRRKTVTGYGVTRSKAEYEDAAAIARREGISLRDAAHMHA